MIKYSVQYGMFIRGLLQSFESGSSNVIDWGFENSEFKSYKTEKGFETWADIFLYGWTVCWEMGSSCLYFCSLLCVPHGKCVLNYVSYKISPYW